MFMLGQYKNDRARSGEVRPEKRLAPHRIQLHG
jgi:hypothetical protein